MPLPVLLLSRTRRYRYLRISKSFTGADNGEFTKVPVFKGAVSGITPKGAAAGAGRRFVPKLLPVPL